MYSVVCSQRVSNFVQLYRCTGDVIQFVGVVHMLSRIGWVGWWMFLHYRGVGFLVLCCAVLCCALLCYVWDGMGWDIDGEGEWEWGRGWGICFLLCID